MVPPVGWWQLGLESLSPDPSAWGSSSASNSLLAPRLNSLPLHLRSLNPWQRNSQPGLGHSGAFPFTRWSFPPQLPGVPSSPTQCSSFPSSRSFSSNRPEWLLLCFLLWFSQLWLQHLQGWRCPQISALRVSCWLLLGFPFCLWPRPIGMFSENASSACSGQAYIWPLLYELIPTPGT